MSGLSWLQADPGERMAEAPLPRVATPHGVWLGPLLLGLAYATAAWLSVLLARLPGEIAHVWYANALAIAVLIHRPPGSWLAPLSAVSAAIVVVNRAWGDDWAQALVFVPPNLLEIMLAAALSRRAGLHQVSLSAVLPLLRLMLYGALLPQLAGAACGALLLADSDLGNFRDIARAWFEGAVIGALSVLPLAHKVLRLGWRELLRQTLQWSHFSMGCLAVGVCLLALAHLPFPFIYLSLPLMLAALLFDFTLVSVLTLAVSLTVAISLATGIFVPPPRLQPWQEVFVYMAWAAALLPAQLLGAALADLRAVNQRLARRSEELREANEGLEQYVRILSHDLREPLNTITQFSGLIEQDAGNHLPDEARTYLALVQRAGTRMRSLLDDLLHYTRLRRGLEGSAQAVPLAELVDQALQSLAGRLRERPAHLDVQRPLPSVRGHAAPLALLVQNLLGNAIKFVPADRVPQVTVQARRAGDWVELTVQDNGIGIAAADIDRLFQPFVRLHVRHRFEGTGLGLALVRQVAEAHGGSVRLESVPGEGSRFTVRLPAA